MEFPLPPELKGQLLRSLELDDKLLIQMAHQFQTSHTKIWIALAVIVAVAIAITLIALYGGGGGGGGGGGY